VHLVAGPAGVRLRDRQLRDRCLGAVRGEAGGDRGGRQPVDASADLGGQPGAAREQERAEFTELVATKGLGAALAWRDARYAEVQ
jgi:hypothetical protein